MRQPDEGSHFPTDDHFAWCHVLISTRHFFGWREELWGGGEERVSQRLCGMPDTTAVATAVSDIIGIAAFYEVVSEFIAADPAVPPSEHGRIDVVYTAEAAAARARGEQ